MISCQVETTRSTCRSVNQFPTHALGELVHLMTRFDGAEHLEDLSSSEGYAFALRVVILLLRASIALVSRLMKFVNEQSSTSDNSSRISLLVTSSFSV